MKIGIFCTNNYTYPLPDGVIYANMSVAGSLADVLVDLGHEVTFFAPVGSETKAQLITFDMLPFSNKEVYGKYPHKDASYHYETTMLIKALNYMEKDNFDIFHSHSRPFSTIETAALKPSIPTVQTVHDPIDDSGYDILHWYKQFSNIHFVSISNSQREPQTKVSWAATVYNGINVDKWSFSDKPGEYLLYIGRIMPEKGPDLAVQIARNSNLPLRLAGTIYPHHQNFFDTRIKPYLGDTIEYLGSLSQEDLIPLYSHALALLMPNRWSEPFGLVAIESMASGTPVIATNKGALPEIITVGKTGYLHTEPENIESFLQSVALAAKLNRTEIRQSVLDRFTEKHMATEYINLYERIKHGD